MFRQVSAGQSALMRGVEWRRWSGEKEGGRREQEASPQASPDRVIDGEELTSRAPNVTLQLNTSCRSTAASPPLSSPPTPSLLLCLSLSGLLIQSSIISILYLLHRSHFGWLLPLFPPHPHLTVICYLSFVRCTSNFS